MSSLLHALESSLIEEFEFFPVFRLLQEFCKIHKICEFGVPQSLFWD